MTIKRIDLSGKRFGRLVVLNRWGSDKHGQPTWLCKCDCGESTIVLGHNLRYGITQSCGCFHINKITKHGKTKTRLYDIWHDMKSRCYNKNSPYYQNYGARDIEVCDKWKDNFQVFYDWAISNGYEESLSIDRIDNNKGYEPNNCRWITHMEQQNNRRNNFNITHNGITKTITQWSRDLGIPRSTLYKRLVILKWNVESAMKK